MKEVVINLMEVIHFVVFSGNEIFSFIHLVNVSLLKMVCANAPNFAEKRKLFYDFC